MNTLRVMATVALAGTLAVTANISSAKKRENGRGTGPVVFVQAQGLYYDSMVLADLPMKGRFQKLLPGVGLSGLATAYGPGDVGYLGGRWWVDANENDIMDDGDAFFLCPLLGPGRVDVER